ncbi:MAG TPA: GNAT family N-acetyltransferase [Gaiellaceae bacterium]|nr:GNAT family N-acetyltransferase [Gaiellaceae bacterium]
MVVIRSYGPSDLDACRRLWVELTEWHRSIYESPSIGGDDPGRQFDEHLARVGPGNIRVAELDGEVVGLAGLVPEARTAELEPVVVAEQQRGRGIGRRLAESVIGEARERGLRQIVVRPVARNADAIRFFHGLGFDVLGQLELVLDLVERETEVWQAGERVADLDFRV